MLNTRNIQVIEHGDFAATMRGKLDALTEPKLTWEQVANNYDWSCGMQLKGEWSHDFMMVIFDTLLEIEMVAGNLPSAFERFELAAHIYLASQGTVRLHKSVARLYGLYPKDIDARFDSFRPYVPHIDPASVEKTPAPEPATPAQVAALQSAELVEPEVPLTQTDAFKVFEQTDPSSEKAAVNWLVKDGFDEVDAKKHWAAWRESKPKKVSRITRRDEKSIRDNGKPENIANLDKGLADGTIEVIPNAYEKPEPKPRDNEDVMAEALEAKYPIKPETIDGLVEAIEYAVKHSNKPEALTLTDGFYAVEVDETLRIKHPALPDINRAIGVRLVSGIYGRAIQRGEVRSLLLRLKEVNSKKAEARQDAARSVTESVAKDVTVTPVKRDTAKSKSKPTGKSEVVYNDKVYSL